MAVVDTSVTAVAVFRGGQSGVESADWASTMATSASDSGAVRATASTVDGLLERGVAATFIDEEGVDAWLEGSGARVLADAAADGWVLASPVILVGAGLSVGPGVGAFRHVIEAGRTVEFVSAQRKLTSAAAQFAGYEGTSVFIDETSGTALSVLRFRSDRTLASWVSSPERQAALPGLRSSLSGDFVEVSDATPFGTIVRTDRGRTLMTPNWKSAMLVLLVLYPTVMLLSRFLGPVLDHAGASPGLALWMSQVVSVGLMQWWLMPWAAKPFRTWLDPIDGAGWRSNAVGAVAILVLYGLTLLLFESVRWLQFWDFRG